MTGNQMKSIECICPVELHAQMKLKIMQHNATACLLLAARGLKLVRTHGCPNYKSLEASKHPLLQVLLSHLVQLFNLKASTPVSLTRWRYDQGGPGWTRVDQGKLPDSHLIFQLLQEIHRIRAHLSGELTAADR